ASASHSVFASAMHAPKSAFDPGSSGSQHGGGLVSHGGPNVPSSHCTWQFAMASVHSSVDLITRCAYFGPSRAIERWHFASDAMSAAAGTATTRQAHARSVRNVVCDMPRLSHARLETVKAENAVSRPGGRPAKGRPRPPGRRPTWPARTGVRAGPARGA